MWFRVTQVATVAVVLLTVTSGSSQGNPQLHPSTPRRGRFLGLLGLLTGLTLVDSLDDSEPHVRAPSGIVKINIGRPFMESFYHYSYNPFYYGSVPTINIKIPLKPEYEHAGFDGVDFGGGSVTSSSIFGGQSGQLGGLTGINAIDPRPVFSDSPEISTLDKEKPKKSRLIQKIKRSKQPSTRIIRSTLRSDVTEDQSEETSDSENQLTEAVPPTTILPPPNFELSDPVAPESATTLEPLTLYQTAIPLIEDNSPVVAQASADTPSRPQSYFSHAGSLQDPAAISLTTAEPDCFKPSLPDRLQDYYSRAAAAIKPEEFRPIVNV